MRFLEILSAHTIMETLGWALLHSLWQGAVIGVLAGAAMGLLQKNTANARYLVAYVALVLMLVLPVFTVLSETSSGGTGPGQAVTPAVTRLAPAILPSPAESSGEVRTEANGSSWKNYVDQRLESMLPWIILVWTLGVVVSSMRLYRSWAQARQLMLGEKQLIPQQWQETLERLMKQLRVTRPVLLIESSLVTIPTAVGWLRPMILLPASALTGLTPRQLETILVHELAHIRRNDYLLNFLQTIIETLLFYHPAVWWLSSQIRVERENCCDDLVVSSTGDATVYARALTQMEKLRRATPSLAVAATGGSLSKRIHRLVKVEPLPATRLWRGFVVVIAVVAAMAGGSQVFQLYTSLAASTQKTGIRSVAPSNFKQESAMQHVQDLGSSEAQKRAMAICSLARGGDVAAIPLLVQALADDAPLSAPVGCWQSGTWTPVFSKFKQLSPGEEAAMALASFGEAAVDPLAAALQDANPSVRRNAAWAIGEIRGGLQVNRTNAVPALLAALSDDDRWVRRAAAFSFGEIRYEGATATLIDRLGDSSSGVREMAARALGEMKASRALKALKVAVTDQDEKVSAAAQWAVNEIRDQ